MKRARVIGAIVFVGGLLFGAFGGEYGTFDWFTLRRQVKEEERGLSELREELDTLARAAKAIEQDPATQERVAREAFGMHRKGERLYKIERSKQ